VTLKVMTWNLENLFRPGAESGPDTQTVYAEKLQGLASIINRKRRMRWGCRRSVTPTPLKIS
jgi:hypothetical protein